MLTARRITKLAFTLMVAFCLQTAIYAAEKTYTLTDETAAKISAAAPDKPFAKPAKPRKVLVYGRVYSHPESVTCCFHAIKEMARKTGAFEAVCTGDETYFMPDRLAGFDAVIMNSTHERNPMRPSDFDTYDAAGKQRLLAREKVLKQSLLDYVAGGGAIVGIHGATAAVQWPEYLDMFKGAFGGVVTETFSVIPVGPPNPITSPFAGRSLQLHDEFYMFKAPYDPTQVHVLLRLDLKKTSPPKPEEIQWGSYDTIAKDYPVSWIRSYGKGRVFYCSLGHFAPTYENPVVLKHFLAGIQWAIGDLKDPAQ